jgi:regulator of CtrA degradation
MGSVTRIGRGENSDTVLFAQHLARSEAFVALYDAGMRLVEETTDYLGDGGKMAVSGLSDQESLLYTTQSMRLTTRLMQVASWLLLQRAINDGEIPVDQGQQEKSKIRLQNTKIDMSVDGWAALPAPFKDLVQRSLQIQSDVCRLNDILSGSQSGSNQGMSVSDQLLAIRREFEPT